jgi:hypothetical protein
VIPIDPLVMDVLCDQRTLRVGPLKYCRMGVLYEFTEDEVLAAMDAMYAKLEKIFL